MQNSQASTKLNKRSISCPHLLETKGIENRLVLEHVEIPPWAQGVGRSNRPAPTNRINQMPPKFFWLEIDCSQNCSSRFPQDSSILRRGALPFLPRTLVKPTLAMPIIRSAFHPMALGWLAAGFKAPLAWANKEKL
jgi:hypothetical protein